MNRREPLRSSLATAAGLQIAIANASQARELKPGTHGRSRDSGQGAMTIQPTPSLGERDRLFAPYAKLRELQLGAVFFGIANAATRSDPEYGKRMYQDHFGDLFYSFDYGGHHFIILDSIQITKSFDYEARIDAPQLAWLMKDLAALRSNTPVIVITHVPLVTGLFPTDLHEATRREKSLWSMHGRF